MKGVSFYTAPNPEPVPKPEPDASFRLHPRVEIREELRTSTLDELCHVVSVRAHLERGTQRGAILREGRGSWTP